MILFYPRDIGLWRQTFDFSSSAPFKRFNDRDDLLGFLKGHGVRLDDPAYPLKIVPDSGPLGDRFAVVQWTCLGWIKDVVWKQEGDGFVCAPYIPEI